MGHGGTCPQFYKWLGTGGTVSRRTANNKLTKLYAYWPWRKRSPKRLLVLLEPKSGGAPPKNFRRFAADRYPHFCSWPVPPTFKFVPAPLPVYITTDACTKSYCLVTEADVCERSAMVAWSHSNVERLRLNPRHKSNALTTAPLRHIRV